MIRRPTPVQTKYQICRLLFGSSFIGAIFCITHLSPFTPAHSNVRWFIMLSISVVIGIASGLGFYYYRAKLREDPIDAIKIEALSNAGHAIKNDSLDKK